MPTLLDSIHTPQQLRKLDITELTTLATELREYLIQNVAETGGHLASNLGVVELTIALHYVFDTPNDRLVWDVGHQTYAHKILTGRREGMLKLRQKGGVAGFPRRAESEYDAFGTGHSSTSVSAALGMAMATQLLRQDRQAIAVIGDGAMTAGMAFEALNNAGHIKANLLVVLNDNDMSISHNVGALKHYLTKLLASRFYGTMREQSKKMFAAVPSVRAFVRRAEEHMKGMVLPGTLFEEFGFNYIGPVDGHNVQTLVSTLQSIARLSGPRLLHVVTQKGKGFLPSEQDPKRFHGVSQFNSKTGELRRPTLNLKTYTEVFSDWLVDMATADDRLVAITPAMCDGSGLNTFSQVFPNRYFDVGIAEQHALTFAAGLACEGLKPVVAIYSTFLQRAYDQLIHDIALQNLPVLLAVDRAGLVGADGPTHAGSFDLSFLGCIPNLLIMIPCDENECRAMLSTGFRHHGPAVVRYPRGAGLGVPITPSLETLEIGKAHIERLGQTIALLVFGTLLAEALKAAETLNATVVNMRFVKPLDITLLKSIAEQHKHLVTLEENAVQGGAGSAVLAALQTLNLQRQVTLLGLPDAFIEHGDRLDMLAHCGLDATGIVRAVLNSTVLNA
ncbi:MAG: 1-deoxy-D-xylulose-5-phosphate synthase [Methylophilaceae bacterium]|nr:1-deoxy-D-xylulose-5-phosphate synthase [Methylophilaceae bacterium]